VLHRLVPRGDPQRRAVVIGAVVQARDPAARMVKHRGDGAVPSAPRMSCGVSTCTSNRRRPAGRSMGGLQPFAHVDHRLDLRDGAHLRQREGETVGREPASSSPPRNRPRVRSPRRRVDSCRLLNRMPMKGGACPDAMAWPTADAAAVAWPSSSPSLWTPYHPRSRCGDPRSARCSACRARVPRPARPPHRRHRVLARAPRAPEAFDRGERLGTPPLRQVGGVPVRRNVHRVHG
jgi:hypothetical protein